MKYYNANVYDKTDRLVKNTVIDVSDDGIIKSIESGVSYSPEDDDFDCEGNVVFPAFMDCTVTLPGKECFSLFGLDISELYTVDQYLYEISYADRERGIRGYGFNTFVLGEKGTQRIKKLLDGLCKDKPAYIYADDMTTVIVNEYILEEAKKYMQVSREVHSDGLLDAHQISILKKYTDIFDFTVDEMKLSLLSFQGRMMLHGVCAIRVIDFLGEKSVIEALKELDDSGQWYLRTIVTVPLYPFDTVDEMYDRFLSYKVLDSDNIYVTGVSITLDGSIDSGQAALIEPYSIDNSWKGDIIWNVDKLDGVVNQFLEDGIDVNFNAFGDRAVSFAVDLVRKDKRKGNVYITHAYLVSDIDVYASRDKNITFCIEPNSVPYNGSFYEGDEIMLGERIYSEYPVGRLLYAGLNVVSGSNNPVQLEVSPINGVYKASHRTSDDDATPYHLLKTYGENAYKSFGLCNDIGNLEVGKKATFCMLTKDIINMREDLLCDCKCVATVIDGRLLRVR